MQPQVSSALFCRACLPSADSCSWVRMLGFVLSIRFVVQSQCSADSCSTFSCCTVLCKFVLSDSCSEVVPSCPFVPFVRSDWRAQIHVLMSVLAPQVTALQFHALRLCSSGSSSHVRALRSVPLASFVRPMLSGPYLFTSMDSGWCSQLRTLKSALSIRTFNSCSQFMLLTLSSQKCAFGVPQIRFTRFGLLVLCAQVRALRFVCSMLSREFTSLCHTQARVDVFLIDIS